MLAHVQPTANCVYCTNSPLFIFSSFLGFSCFSIRCTHATEPYKIKPSWTRVAMSLTSVLLTSIKVVYLTRTKPEEKLTNFLKLTADFLSSAGCVVLIINNLLSTRDRIRFYEGIVATLHMGKEFGINHLLRTTTVKKFRERGYIVVALSIFCALVHSLVVKKFGNVLTIYIYLLMGFCYVSEMAMHKEMLLTCYGYLRKILVKRYKVHEEIPKVQRLHMCIIYNFEYCNRFCSRTVFMGLMFAMSMAILYVYVLLVDLFFKDVQFEVWERVDMVFLLMLVFLPGTYQMFIVEDVNKSSDDVLSFLFRYPISKLSADEAAQVELLITTLTTQKPILRASNIFTVGTRLLASISGTVVTYLLVALQFHMNWTRKSVENN